MPLSRGGIVERLVFGEEDAATELHAFCRRELGSGVAAELFSATSVGVVTGVELEDGRRVVVKAHQPRQGADFLGAVHRVQAHLHREGFPAPEPLLPPRPLGRGLALVEELVERGAYEDAHDPRVRRTAAEALAWLVELAAACGRPEGLRRGWRLLAGDGLWPPEAHSPIFDFAATSEGADWIDRHAARARPLALAARGEVAGHDDWSAKHLRYERGTVAVVYDWDSLTLAPEAKLVGTAAATFTANAHLPVPLAPTPDEAAGFVEDYAAARPLRAADRRAAHATAAYVVAYTARCEHALGRRGDFTEALARFGDAYQRS